MDSVDNLIYLCDVNFIGYLPPNNAKIQLFITWTLVFLLFSNNGCPPNNFSQATVLKGKGVVQESKSPSSPSKFGNFFFPSRQKTISSFSNEILIVSPPSEILPLPPSVSAILHSPFLVHLTCMKRLVLDLSGFQITYSIGVPCQ